MSLWERYKAIRQYRRARVLAIFVLGTIGGALVHLNDVRWSERGRDAFLANRMQYENRRFDRLMLHPHSLFAQVVSVVAELMLAALIYELLVAAFTAILRAPTPEA
jgi:hypothetical protein